MENIPQQNKGEYKRMRDMLQIIENLNTFYLCLF